MRWLWKGWPMPVKRGRSANTMLTGIIDSTAYWQLAEDNSSVGTVTSSNSSLTMPDGSQYILKAGNISLRVKSKTTVLDKDITLGTALAVSPDKMQLVVSGSHSHWLYDYIIHPDGTLHDKQKLYWLHNPGNDDTSEVRSMAFDTSGNLYVATEMGVQVCDQNGRVRAILSVPSGPVTSLWFGGENYDYLFIISAGKVYKRKLKVAGAMPSQPAFFPVSQGAG
jgi:gluconolactonase